MRAMLCLLSVFLIISGGCVSSTGGHVTSRSVDFEDGRFGHFVTERSRNDSIMVVAEEDNNKVVKFTATHTDRQVNNGYRSELKDKSSLPYNTDVWISFRWKAPARPNGVKFYGKNIIFQIHARPDKSIGEPWRRPIFAFYDFEHEGLEISGRWSPKRKNSDGDYNVGFNYIAYDEKYWKRDVWHTVLINIRLAYNESGYAKVWLDGDKVVDCDNIGTAYNDRKGPFVKFGTYHEILDRPDQKYVIFFDDYKQGATLEDVQ